MTMTVEEVLEALEKNAHPLHPCQSLAEDYRRLRAENADLLAMLAQERKRLDWALKVGAEYKYGTLAWANEYLLPASAETDDPRATIDVLLVEKEEMK